MTVFISHTSKNDPFVAALRLRLELRGYTVLEDTQFLPGDNLPEKIRGFIDRAAVVIAVGSTAANGSHWVKRELRYARKKGKRIIPLLLPKTSTAELRAIFELPEPAATDDLEDWPAEVLGIRVPDGAGGLDALMPGLLDALEGRISGGGTTDPGPARPPMPLADLVLRLRAPRFDIVKNPHGAEMRRPVATASLAYYPPGAAEPAAESPDFTFIAPLGGIEAVDLRFYLERYILTPYGTFRERARGIENALPEWGRELWDTFESSDPDPDPDSVTPDERKPMKAWKAAAARSDRRFTVQAPPVRRLRKSATEAELSSHRKELEAVTGLLALPWELLHDDDGYLFLDGMGVRVRRSLPGGEQAAKLADSADHSQLRVLAVCARPETDGIDYIDHRVSIQPLCEALNALGGLAEYEILSPPTFSALCERLRAAIAAGRPFHVVHFDGHGVFDKAIGLGKLVFEHQDDSGKLHGRRADIVPADRLGAELRSFGVGMFFLEACQSVQAEGKGPEASVAGRLLQCGIASVVAMSHSVLVETARRFTAAFYPALAAGNRVGWAMLAGQRQLERHRQRGWGWEPQGQNGGSMQRIPLELQDWFVPVLYQGGDDPVLLPAPPPVERVQQELAKDRALATGNLPPAPAHSFVGRSRQILAAERLMLEAGKPYVVLRGEGGEGKTTLATELARWLVTSGRASKAAFASVENLPPGAARAVLAQWGAQFVPDFAARADTEEHTLGVLADALRNHAAVLVLDNMESILPPPPDSSAAGARVADPDVLASILTVCRSLCNLAPRTRIIFTSREALPTGSPFGDPNHLLEVGRLSRDEGMELVSRVLAASSRHRVSADALRAEKEDDIADLVTTVQAHARSLVLLAPELADRGLRATTDAVAAIMADLERRYPGERERSLFASVEISLRRLPTEVRSVIAPLGVVQGGGCVWSLMDIIERDADTTLQICTELARVGLCEPVPVGDDNKMPSDIYFRFDPALAPALLRELREQGGDAEGKARMLWAQSYRNLAGLFYTRQFQEAQLAVRLTLLELPNLLAALRAWNGAMNAANGSVHTMLTDATPANVIEFATNVEGLLQRLGRQEALLDVVVIRTHAASLHARQPGQALTNAACNAVIAELEGHLDAGRFSEAVNAAQALSDQCEAANDDAFPELGYDRATALGFLGLAYRKLGHPDVALNHLQSAYKRIEFLATTLPDSGHRETAALMVPVCLTRLGDCLTDLGQLEAAAERYEKAVGLHEAKRNQRGGAVAKFQLATVRHRQRRFDEALKVYTEACETFTELREPQSIASTWHQIGIVHQETGNLERAENAYLQSLKIRVSSGDKPGEASTRNQLGTLYNLMPGHRRNAVVFFLQAAEIFAAPANADPLREGFSRSNAAVTLISLGRYAEARTQVQRALACKSNFGLNAAPWTTWDILHDLETAEGNLPAAAEARARAVASYAAARRGGWEVPDGAAAPLCDLVRVTLAAREPGTSADVITPDFRIRILEVERRRRAELTALARDSESEPWARALATALLAILDGSRDPALADDPALYYADAVELGLLLENL